MSTDSTETRSEGPGTSGGGSPRADAPIVAREALLFVRVARRAVEAHACSVFGDVDDLDVGATPAAEEAPLRGLRRAQGELARVAAVRLAALLLARNAAAALAALPGFTRSGFARRLHAAEVGAVGVFVAGRTDQEIVDAAGDSEGQASEGEDRNEASHG